MKKELLDVIVSYGDRGAVVPFSRVGDIKKDLMDLKNGDYHTDWIDRMAKHVTHDENKFIPEGLGFEPRSLISIAMPSYRSMLQFRYKGKPIDCTLPPIYAGFYQSIDRVLQYLCEHLSPLGLSAAKTLTFPHKLLSARCGLGMYGRNNIIYHEDFGSYLQVMTFLSDLPYEEAEWFPARRLETCEKCTACVASCPTGAIDPERRLIDSDRCLTYYNEPPGGFPEWLDKKAHNCVVGCILCQDCCPENGKNRDNIRIGAIFTEDETDKILSCKADGRYSESLAAKIALTDIAPECMAPDVLPRNLAALLEAMG
jgi:epoxyqueuosine reductase